MTENMKKRLLSFVLSMMLIVAMACNMTGCNDSNPETPNTGTEADGGSAVDGNVVNDSQVENITASDVTILGDGENIFSFSVVDVDGREKFYEIHTDKTMVGEALLELNLIAGDAGDFGLYVKTVDGITVDYDKDGKYWAFYVNGQYAVTGVDATPIVEGEEYSFKVE